MKTTGHKKDGDGEPTVIFPCPFCGNYPPEIRIRKTAIIECPKCNAMFIKKTKAEAVATWNNRYEICWAHDNEITETRARLQKIERFIEVTAHGANTITAYREIFKEGK